MDCTTPEKLCSDCKPIYQNLLMAYGPYQLDLPPGYYPVLFSITLPPKMNLKFVDTMGKAIENTLALSYGMLNAKVWKIVYYEDEGGVREGKGKDKEKKKSKKQVKDRPATLKLLIDFPHKIKVLDDMRSGIFLQFPIPKGASEWEMHLPEEVGADSKPGHESLARLRFWKEVDELFTAKRILNNDMRK
ncbi:hypothetical protein BJX65DRAFT_301962 [Aspergillus insuetus]